MKILTYTIEGFVSDIKSLCRQIQSRSVKYDSVIAVTRGGVVPSGFLSQYLNIKKLYACGGCFDEKNDFVFINEPTKIKGTVIMISDLFKTGKTLKIIKNAYLELGDKDLRIDIACIHYFPSQSQSIITPDYFVHRVDEDLFVNYPWE